MPLCLSAPSSRIHDDVHTAADSAVCRAKISFRLTSARPYACCRGTSIASIVCQLVFTGILTCTAYVHVADAVHMHTKQCEYTRDFCMGWTTATVLGSWAWRRLVCVWRSPMTATGTDNRPCCSAKLFRAARSGENKAAAWCGAVPTTLTRDRRAAPGWGQSPGRW